jgi:hypothetical protein
MSDPSKGLRISTAALIGSLLIAVALGAGLFQVGSGMAARGNNSGLTITGSAHANVLADRAVWTLTVQEIAPTAGGAVAKVASGVSALIAYLQRGGINTATLELSGVSTTLNQEYVNGNPTGRILNYQASRNVTTRTNNVNMIQKISQGLGVVLQTGVNIFSSGPQYYVSTLDKLRPTLIADAMRDAKTRAIALTSATGGSVGAVRNARSGPFQVTAADSIEVSSGGVYDTSSIQKTVTTTVTVTFALG